MYTEINSSDSIEKARTLANEILADVETSCLFHALSLDAEAKLQERIERQYRLKGAEIISTGGNIDVLIIPVDAHTTLGITGETFVAYWHPTLTSPYEIFLEATNDGEQIVLHSFDDSADNH